MNCSLFGLTCSVQCINKVFITVANGDIETVTKVVGEYGLLYLNQVSSVDNCVFFFICVHYGQ